MCCFWFPLCDDQDWGPGVGRWTNGCDEGDFCHRAPLCCFAWTCCCPLSLGMMYGSATGRYRDGCPMVMLALVLPPVALAMTRYRVRSAMNVPRQEYWCLADACGSVFCAVPLILQMLRASAIDQWWCGMYDLPVDQRRQYPRFAPPLAEAPMGPVDAAFDDFASCKSDDDGADAHGGVAPPRFYSPALGPIDVALPDTRHAPLTPPPAAGAAVGGGGATFVVPPKAL